MNSKSISKRETKRLKEIIREYKSKNFKIYTDDKYYEKPWEINGYIPDIIAIKDNRIIIIEVKSYENIELYKNKIDFFSNFVKNNDEYEFQLIYTNPKFTLSDKEKINIYENTLNDLYKYELNNINTSIKQHMYKSAFLEIRYLCENMLKFYAMKYKIFENVKNIKIEKIIDELYLNKLLSNHNRDIISSIIHDKNKTLINNENYKEYLNDYLSLLKELKKKLL